MNYQICIDWECILLDNPHGCIYNEHSPKQKSINIICLLKVDLHVALHRRVLAAKKLTRKLCLKIETETA